MSQISPPIGLDRFQAEVGHWAEQIFPQSTPANIARHLFREAVELCFATRPAHIDPHDLLDALSLELARVYRVDRPWQDDTGPLSHEVAAESADIALLLLHLAHKEGYSLLTAIHAKYAVNQARQWGEPDAEGVVEHVEGEDQP